MKPSNSTTSTDIAKYYAQLALGKMLIKLLTLGDPPKALELTKHFALQKMSLAKLERLKTQLDEAVHLCQGELLQYLKPIIKEDITILQGAIEQRQKPLMGYPYEVQNG